MPRLKIHQRERLIEIYKKNKRDLLLEKNKWKYLQNLCQSEDIIIGIKAIRKIINEFVKFGRIFPIESKSRRINKTKITLRQIRQINNLVNNNRELTGLQIKNELNLDISPRTN